MASSRRKLDSEIAAALAVKHVDVGKLFAWRPKVAETIVDIHEGRPSRSTGAPLSVSQLDSPRGAYWIVDGHHRAVEAVQAGLGTVPVVIDRHIPRVERTGGAYREVLADRVRVVDAVRGRR